MERKRMPFTLSDHYEQVFGVALTDEQLAEAGQRRLETPKQTPAPKREPIDLDEVERWFELEGKVDTTHLGS